MTDLYSPRRPGARFSEPPRGANQPLIRSPELARAFTEAEQAVLNLHKLMRDHGCETDDCDRVFGHVDSLSDLAGSYLDTD